MHAIQCAKHIIITHNFINDKHDVMKESKDK